MKQILTFFVILCSYMLCGAQAITLTVDNQTPGWLSSKINYGDQQTVENLTVTGYLNLIDLNFIGDLMSKHNLSGRLNLTDVEVVDTEFKDTPSSIGASLYMFNLNQSVSLERFSIPKSLSKISKYLLAGVKADTIDYGSEICNVLSGYLGTNRYNGTNYCPKVLVLREGVTKIEKFGTDEGNEKNLQSLHLPQTLDSIGENAFISCSNLNSVNLPEKIHTIGDHAFGGTSFEPDTLNLPSSLKIYHVTSFPIKQNQVIVVPKIERIGFGTSSWGVSKNDHLTFYMASKTKPDTYEIPYENCLSGCTFYVPEGSLKSYTTPDMNIANHYNLNPFCFATVIELIEVQNIGFNLSDVLVYVGESVKNEPFFLPANATNKELNWNSADTDIAIVEQDGTVNAIGYGITTIGAITKYGEKTASYKIYVYEHVTSIELPSTLSIKISEKKKLAPEILPIGKTDGKLSWMTSDSDIATVDENGNVKGITKGICTITATSIDGGYTAQCMVTVVQPVETVTITPKTATVIVGELTTLSATVLPSNADDKSIIWNSADEEVATVSDGVVSAVGPGITKIYAISNYDNEIKDFCEVTVIQPATGIALNTNEIELTEDDSYKLEASVLPENASNKGVNWTSSDISIVMISADGTVYAIKPGQATIMATTVDGGYVALCKITVKAKTVLATSIQLNSSVETLAVGESVQLTASITPENASNKNIVWTSTSSSVATVNTTGLIKALSEGSTQIVATTTDGTNLSAICEITVNKQFVSIAGIKIDPSTAKIPIGEKIELTAEIIPDDATTKDISWSSTNPAVAAVSQTGEVMAISEGDVIIIASTKDGSNLSATCSINVYDASGVEAVIEDMDSYVRIYNLSGYLIYEGAYADAKLSAGFYIIVYNGSSYKLKID